MNIERAQVACLESLMEACSTESTDLESFSGSLREVELLGFNLVLVSQNTGNWC